jgi:hypothetical protein
MNVSLRIFFLAEPQLRHCFVSSSVTCETNDDQWWTQYKRSLCTNRSTCEEFIPIHILGAMVCTCINASAASVSIVWARNGCSAYP